MRGVGQGKGVTCNGFWGLGGQGKKVSRVTVSVVWEGGGAGKKVSHVTVSGVWEDRGKRCHV